MPTARLDHVALLVPDLAAAVARVGLPAGPEDAFPAEGTREVYVGEDARDARLLLVTPLEPASESPYARALRRRGPGLHHLGLAVPDVEAYVASLAGSGWYLLPQSLATLRASNTVWLARPGAPALVEVAAGRLDAGEPVVAKVELPGRRAGLMASLGVAAICASPDGATWVTVGDRRQTTSAWCGVGR